MTDFTLNPMIRCLDAYLRQRDTGVVAIVGGGGKTTLMNLLNQVYSPIQRVIFTTTTAMFEPNTPEMMLMIQDKLSKDSFFSQIQQVDWQKKTLAIYGRHDVKVPHKLRGIEPEIVDWIESHNSSDLVLVEADGANRKPLKAYAAHEPVIPKSTHVVMVVLGLSGLKYGVSDEKIHRRTHFQQLVHKSEGESLSLDDIHWLFEGQDGFMKGVPQSADVLVVLNQADCDGFSDKTYDERFEKLARVLKKHRQIRGVFVTSLERGICYRHYLKDEPSELKVGAVILAAGASSRMKTNKLLMALGDEPVIEHVLATIKRVSFEKRVLIAGRDADQVRRISEKHKVPWLLNRDYLKGQSTSLKLGLEAVAPFVDGCMFIMGDQPFVDQEVLDEMIWRFKQSDDPKCIIVPRFDNRRGAPVLFGAFWFNALKDVEGDVGGRAVLNEAEAFIQYIELDNRVFFMDVDDPEAYDAAVRIVEGRDGRQSKD